MAIEKILQNQTVSKLTSKISNGASSVFSKLGSALEKSPHADKFDKAIKLLDPTGANNTFIGIATLMVSTVIIPRVLTASKRNPDNPEATKDEIKEILFRDVQTVLIILFALKAINSVVANIATKMGGLPMANKPYQKLFSDSSVKFSDKAKEFIEHPFEKFKIAGKNILGTLHPTDGIYALTNDEHVAKYSNYTFEDLTKMLDMVEENGGNKTKVYNRILDSIIKKYETILNGNNKTNFCIQDIITSTKSKDGKNIEYLTQTEANIKATIEALKELKAKGPQSITEIDNEAVKGAISDFLKDQNNDLVKSAKRLNASLRTGALAFEAGYLGWGLPGINQLRLEKKYLKNGGEDKTQMCSNCQNDRYSGTLIGKNIKAYEVKLYHNFIK